MNHGHMVTPCYKGDWESGCLSGNLADLIKIVSIYKKMGNGQFIGNEQCFW